MNKDDQHVLHKTEHVGDENNIVDATRFGITRLISNEHFARMSRKEFELVTRMDADRIAAAWVELLMKEYDKRNPSKEKELEPFNYMAKALENRERPSI